MTTGWPPGLLQDYYRKLSKWFASRPEARYLVRRNLMTDCTLADQARYLADNVREMPASCAIALRSLANQLEALTAERETFLAAGRVLAKVTQEFIELTAERDALTADAARYWWMRDRFLGADFNWNEMGKQVLMIEWPGGSVNGDLDTTLATAMKDQK